jgi:ubiquinone biosynthesis protein COQ9
MMTSENVERERQRARDRLLEAALGHVVFDGWGMTALVAGAADLDLPEGQIHAVFINPERDLLAHFSDWADRRMLIRLSEMDLPSMKVRQRITAAVRARLEVLSGHEEAVRRAIGSLALPGNAGAAARQGYCTVDTIWRVAGDEATDFNFYTKRGLLAAVLASTTLFWLDDESEEHEETWAFLDRRIAEIMQIPKFQARLASRVREFGSLLVRSGSRTSEG